MRLRPTRRPERRKGRQESGVLRSPGVTIAKPAGKVPAAIKRLLDGAVEAAVDRRELLRRAWSETTPADYSWMRPNRRHIWRDSMPLE